MSHSISRNYEIKEYVKFVDFVKTVTSPNTLFPYGNFVRSIDFTAVNRYGIDMRAYKLIACCKNLFTMTLGHPTSLRPNTFRLMAETCKRLQTLHMGGLGDHPFILECDFSGMEALRTVEIYTTALAAESIKTLPRSVEHVRLIQVDTINDDDLKSFLNGRSALQSLVLDDCRFIRGPIAEMIEPLTGLKKLVLRGSNIDDDSLQGLDKLPFELDTLRIAYTRVSPAFLETLTAGQLKVRRLEIS